MTRFLLLLLAFALAFASAAQAGVLSLSHDEAAQKLRVYDGATASSASLSSVGLGVQAGSVTADAPGDRVFFVTNQGGAQTLYSLGYGPVGGVESATLPDTLRVTHLEWDGSGTPRLVGVGLRNDGGEATLVRFQGGVLTDLGMPLSGCCEFRTGVSAFRASDNSLFLVGRLDGESQERIFRFVLGASPTVTSAPLDVDLSVLELAVAGDGLAYGLAHSGSVGRTRLVAFDAALSATVRGEGVDGCCFVLAGSSAIDPATGDLVVVGTGTAAMPGAARLWRFALATGAVTDGVTAITAVGLFHDTTAVMPAADLFGDGFESGLPLPRAAGAAR